MDRVVFDMGLFPLVFLRFPPSGTDDAIHAWHDEVERILRTSHEPVALVHDLRPLEFSAVTAAHRAIVAERTQRLRAAPFVDRYGADARIVHNALVAGAASAVSWLVGGVPWPQLTTTSEEEAIRWSLERLASRRGERADAGHLPRGPSSV